MLCDHCGENEAIIHLTQIVNNQMSTFHLCERCAAEKGLEPGVNVGNFPLTDFLAQMGKGGTSEAGSAGPCAYCGLKLDDFKKTGRLGCSHCYVTFEPHLRGLLRRLHGGTQHLGKVYLPPDPSKAQQQERLAGLKRKLDRAVSAEDFERAAKLRDMIRELEARGPHADVVLSTRIRLARNLQAHAYTPRIREPERQEIFEQVKEAAQRAEALHGGVALEVGELTPLSRRVLLERHLISRELVDEGEITPPRGTGLIMSSREDVGLMVNEEDHLRLQCLLSGLQLQQAYQLADSVDEELGASLPMAYHHEFGYLTSCPTNVGTGLRASILIHLPGLVLTKEIGKVLQGLGQVGLTFRGLYGEGSEVVGNFFQVSNQTTLGKSEEDLLDHLQKIVGQVIQYEMQARSVLMRDARTVMEDKIWRAYGLLRYARSLSFEEVMNLLSGVRLGVSMNLLGGLRVYTLNKIMIFSQAAHLEQAAGRALSDAESDLHRAAYVRRILEREGQVSADAQAAADDNGA